MVICFTKRPQILKSWFLKFKNYKIIGRNTRKRSDVIKVGYVRVSTIDQNEARQVEALKQYGIEKWFIEKVSGKDTNRPQLQEMLRYVREGDIVYVHDFSRLARSTKDLLDIVEQFQKDDVQLISLKEQIDTKTPAGKLMLTMIGAIYEFERMNTLERQREGIAIAKAQGKFKGGQPKEYDEEKFEILYKKYMKREITKTEMAKRLNVSRPTLSRIIEKKKEQGLI